MKISICSDIHLEFGPIVLSNDENADVLILSGDICVADDLRKDLPMLTARQFFNDCSENFPKVIYVMGNHEHYHGDFGKSAEILREFLKPYDNVFLLDKESIEIDGKVFFGGTLWTNFDAGNGPGDSFTMRTVESIMNDYRGVINSKRKVSMKIPVYERNQNGDPVMIKDERGYEIPKQIGVRFSEREAKFSSEDSYEDFLAFMVKLDEHLEMHNSKDFVVVGHHGPSKKSIHPRYQHETLINAAYSSDLDGFIKARPRIKLWTHGHTHEPFDYEVGETRIVCNPRGYIGYEKRAYEFSLKTIEI